MTCNYRRGANAERRIVNKAREAGLISFRTAGSKSGSACKIDVCIIDENTKSIEFIQCKPKSISGPAIERTEQEGAHLNGSYTVCYKVVAPKRKGRKT